jgi:hypothetical protein
MSGVRLRRHHAYPALTYAFSIGTDLGIGPCAAMEASGHGAARTACRFAAELPSDAALIDAIGDTSANGERAGASLRRRPRMGGAGHWHPAATALFRVLGGWRSSALRYTRTHPVFTRVNKGSAEQWNSKPT